MMRATAGGPFGVVGAATAIAAAQTLGVPYILGKGGIPFIALSSGSVAANGAISAITSLGVTYASAYCWFPANILATVKAAGWYYCTFSSATAGTAFLDTYTSGIPVIPASPTAVTDGKGAFTGETAEVFGPTVTVPANSMGKNGQLRTNVQYYMTSNANAKRGIVRFSGNAGTTFQNTVLDSNAGAFGPCVISNRGATNSQIGFAYNLTEGNSTSDTARTAAAVDTTAATTVVFSMSHATATDNVVLEQWTVELFADGN